MLQAGPKTSALVVTPFDDAAGADDAGAAGAAEAAGALAGALVVGAAVPPQAVSVTVSAASAPTAASR
jgi:hypothetical protein